MISSCHVPNHHSNRSERNEVMNSSSWQTVLHARHSLSLFSFTLFLPNSLVWNCGEPVKNDNAICWSSMLALPKYTRAILCHIELGGWAKINKKQQKHYYSSHSILVDLWCLLATACFFPYVFNDGCAVTLMIDHIFSEQVMSPYTIPYSSNDTK